MGLFKSGVQGLTGGGGSSTPTPPAVTETEKNQIFTPTLGQTSFILTFTPVKPQNTKLYVSGLKQQYGVDFTVTGNVLTLTPQFLAEVKSNPVPLLDITYSTSSSA